MLGGLTVSLQSGEDHPMWRDSFNPLQSGNSLKSPLTPETDPGWGGGAHQSVLLKSFSTGSPVPGLGPPVTMGTSTAIHSGHPRHAAQSQHRRRGSQVPPATVSTDLKNVSCSVMSGSLRPPGTLPTRLLCPWASPGKDTGVGSHLLLQGIFQRSNSGLLRSGRLFII